MHSQCKTEQFIYCNQNKTKQNKNQNKTFGTNFLKTK